MVVGSEDPLGGGIVDILACAKPTPQFIGSRKTVNIVVPTRKKIMLDDAVAVCGVRKLETQYLGVIFRLLDGRNNG